MAQSGIFRSGSAFSSMTRFAANALYFAAVAFDMACPMVNAHEPGMHRSSLTSSARRASHASVRYFLVASASRYPEHLFPSSSKPTISHVLCANLLFFGGPPSSSSLQEWRNETREYVHTHTHIHTHTERTVMGHSSARQHSPLRMLHCAVLRSLGYSLEGTALLFVFLVRLLRHIGRRLPSAPPITPRHVGERLPRKL